MEELQRNSSINHGLVTEQDVEQKSKELRMLGDTLTELKSKSCMDKWSTLHIVCSYTQKTFCGAAYLHHPFKIIFHGTVESIFLKSLITSPVGWTKHITIDSTTLNHMIFTNRRLSLLHSGMQQVMIFSD